MSRCRCRPCRFYRARDRRRAWRDGDLRVVAYVLMGLSAALVGAVLGAFLDYLRSR